MPNLKQPETVLLEYTDADGVFTRREVDVLSTRTEGGKTYLRTFCHARGDERTFRLDRIESIIDDNGEVFDPREWISQLRKDANRIDGRVKPLEQHKAPSARMNESSETTQKAKWTVGKFFKFVAAGLVAILGIGAFIDGDPESGVISFLIIGWLIIYLPVWLIVWLVGKIFKKSGN